MNDKRVHRPVDDLTGQPAPGTYRDVWDDHPGNPAAGDVLDEGVVPTGTITWQFGQDQPAEEPKHSHTVQVEWALWGKDASDPGYRVLRCSEGTFEAEDFHGIITRYASGVKETLPQYTVCWIPDAYGNEGYVAVGIHELADADPSRSGGRVRAARGRQIEYLRLFCIPYDVLDKYKPSYTELAKAVAKHQLPVGSTEPVPIELPEPELPSLAGPNRFLAANVAALLLTTDPVYVLDAESATPQERLRFIDQVMSLLPYGLRATMSASTWASATADELKLRLFFTSTELDDGGRAHHVTWNQPRELDLSAPEYQSSRHYLNWLKHVGPGVASALADQTTPVRFRPNDIRVMITNLPEDRPVGDLIEELADRLRRKDVPAVQATIRLLKQYQAGSLAPHELLPNRQAIRQLHLLKDHRGMHHQTNASLYRVLLNVGFETPISYRIFCEIEDCVGGPLPETLRRVLLERKFSEPLPFMLICKQGGISSDLELAGRLYRNSIPAIAILQAFQLPGGIHPEHRAAAYDFGVLYLRTYSADPRWDLERSGYLAKILEYAFPEDQRAQTSRLVDTLWFVHGKKFTRDEVSRLHEKQHVLLTPALEAAIKFLTLPSKAIRPSTIRLLQRNGAGGRAAVIRANVVIWGVGVIVVVLLLLIVLHIAHG